MRRIAKSRLRVIEAKPISESAYKAAVEIAAQVIAKK